MQEYIKRQFTEDRYMKRSEIAEMYASFKTFYGFENDSAAFS